MGSISTHDSQFPHCLYLKKGKFVRLANFSDHVLVPNSGRRIGHFYPFYRDFGLVNVFNMEQGDLIREDKSKVIDGDKCKPWATSEFVMSGQAALTTPESRKNLSLVCWRSVRTFLLGTMCSRKEPGNWT